MKRKNKKKDINSFCKYLKEYHTGMENVINRKEIKKSFKIKENTSKYYVSLLRKAGIPICSCRYGYFFPDTYSEVMDNVMRFNKYISTLSATSADMVEGKI